MTTFSSLGEVQRGRRKGITSEEMRSRGLRV